MATVTHEIATADSSNVTSYATAAFTPATGDLLVFFVDATTTVATGTATASANGVTFTKVLSSVRGTSAHTEYCFIADQLTTGAASMTCTFDCTGDAATGAITMVAAVAGMTQVGLAAIRQSVKLDNQTAGTTPSFVFGAACLTGNVTMATVGFPSATGSTPPSGWTEGVDSDTGATYATPTAGATYNFRASGFTGTTITWGGSVTGAWGGLAIELDASAPAYPFELLTPTPRYF